MILEHYLSMVYTLTILCESMRRICLFLMVKAPRPYRVPIQSYSKTTHPFSILKRVLDQRCTFKYVNIRTLFSFQLTKAIYKN